MKSPLSKPLYKIADISEMTLRVYVSETQLSKIKVGQQVTVKIDTERNEILSRNSFLIASSAEFTPKSFKRKKNE
jgi:HlyD family secretion protein